MAAGSMRLDHLIATVPDIRAAHRRLLGMGFDEAWPIGPFWPAALTSGIALGGANLELVQPDAGVSEARISTLVLAPVSLDEGFAMLHQAGYGYEQKVKEETNPDLLALRGFPPEEAARPQRICENLYPEEDEADYPFFLCLYAPFLKERLAPARFSQPCGPLFGLSLRAPLPEAARRLFAGHLGPIELDVDAGPPEIVEIRLGNEFRLTAGDL